ncbi:MAG: serine/threonine-protein kinase [Polyangiaceae bacterium]
MSLPGSRKPPGELPPTATVRRSESGSMSAAIPRRTASGEVLAQSSGQPSSGHFRSSNPDGDSFRPLIELGRGGMARVYLAEKTTRGLRRLVVLKILEPTFASDPDMRAAFRREAEVCARLNHPNIVQVFEVVEEASSPIIVMEYVEGVSLSQVLSRTEYRLPIRLHVHVIMQILAGLQYFHELRGEDGNPLLGVHRDVSPQNVLVMHEGAVKVLDFGIAKVHGTADADATRAGVIKGKLNYMPPEQLLGDISIDRRADIFPVGVMLWEAFARRRIWEGWEQQNIMKLLMNGPLPPISEVCPWISAAMVAVIARATAVKREDRFATALEMQVALEDCMPELGGAVQQREIASFMEAEFGEWRRDRQRLVDAEVRKPAVALDSVLEVSEVEEISFEDEASQRSQRSLVRARTEDSPFAPRSRGPLWALLGAALLGVALIVWHFGSASSVADPPPSVSAATAKPQVRLQVVASPIDAEILLDGKPVGQNPWHIELDATPRKARIEVRAPGYASNVREVDLTQDADLSVRLEPLPTSVAPPTAGAEPRGSKNDSSKHPTRSSDRSVVVRPSPKPAVPASPARNCSPPYVLDTDGVKTYKPECL